MAAALLSHRPPLRLLEFCRPKTSPNARFLKVAGLLSILASVCICIYCLSMPGLTVWPSTEPDNVSSWTSDFQRGQQSDLWKICKSPQVTLKRLYSDFAARFGCASTLGTWTLGWHNVASTKGERRIQSIWCRYPAHESSDLKSDTSTACSQIADGKHTES